MPISTGSSLGSRLAAASGLALPALLAVACASAPVAPTASLTAARDAIARAEQSDARQYAGAELDEAGQKLTLAESAAGSERMLEAERLAQESRVTAELAIARTTYAKTSEVNRQMGRGADALDEEMERMGEQQ